MMHDWGHKIIYDTHTLDVMLCQTGFSEVKVCAIGQSDIPCFKNAERHGEVTPKWANELETIVVEATK